MGSRVRRPLAAASLAFDFLFCFCQISSGELSTASAKGHARIMVVVEHRTRLGDAAVTCMCLRDYAVIVFVEDFDAV